MIKIYHNRMCSKSCAALNLLQEKGLEIQIQEYIHHVPSKYELIELLTLLKLKPLELIRQKEPLFQEKFQDLLLTEEEWIDIMLEHPILIERPIVVKDGKAVIGRPLEKIVNLLID
ncbi:arsenate reductase (glutaredoxin) [Sphingobacterium sp. SRCM116780]|uniref:arsenate reductase (glutaredoxin) n=1 Tax=Sphingobacterium sp. SRCM116780 TaxID=2907623 RepID=UPI001EEC136C|nr:arsenate reductase (glutaredoxin) [Sphingobacterium sp. SRCM116780]UIR54804.1 arsenate reductase (glutaredoxin) [Sphingobacterium sp. SRCM116780]